MRKGIVAACLNGHITMKGITMASVAVERAATDVTWRAGAQRYFSDAKWRLRTPSGDCVRVWEVAFSPRSFSE